MTRPRRMPNLSRRLRLECLEDRSVPATFNVTTTLDVVDPADGNRSLREAITAANDLAGADVIVLPAGAFRIALDGADENFNATGDYDVTDAVTIRGAGAGVTIVNAQQKDRLFELLGQIDVRFKGMTLRLGKSALAGGAVQAVDANITLTNCLVCDNRALKGGGVNGENGDVSLVGTTVSRNVAETDGGGVNAELGKLTLSGSTVRRNLVPFGAGLGGGVKAAEGVVTNSTVTGNSAMFGGGMYVSALTLIRSVVSRNTASEIGGGIVSQSATLSDSTVSDNTGDTGGGVFAGNTVVTNSTISGNFATGNGGGGGIHTGNLTLTNSTVSGNATVGGGGGIFVGGAGTILNCTITENSSDAEGGGLFRSFLAPGTLELRNTIVALNLIGFGGAPGSGQDVDGVFVSLGHNLIGDGFGSTDFTDGVNGDIVGTSANPIDPKLGPLANNGGRTKTHALKAGSRAIDAGGDVNLPPTDQRGPGFPRKKDGNFNGVAIVDIGAFEK